jgi:hypothetical protein
LVRASPNDRIIKHDPIPSTGIRQYTTEQYIKLLKNGRIKPPEFRSSWNCLEGTQTGQGDDDRSANQLAAAMLFQGPDVELIGDRLIQHLPVCKRTPISPPSSSVK